MFDSCVGVVRWAAEALIGTDSESERIQTKVADIVQASEDCAADKSPEEQKAELNKIRRACGNQLRLALLMMTDENILTMRYMLFATRETWSEQSQLASGDNGKCGPDENLLRQVSITNGAGERLLRRSWDHCFNDATNFILNKIVKF